MKQNKKNPLVTIIILTFNNRDIIGTCLDSIKKLHYKNYECFVIDDNSHDGTDIYIRKHYPFVTLVKKKESSGIAKSRNIGINYAKGKYILFLDSDVILKKAHLDEQVKLMERDINIAICGSKLLSIYNPKVLDQAGSNYYKIGIGIDQGLGENASSYNKKKDVFFVGGAAQFVRSNIFKSIGNYDEATDPYGCDDVDICWRARLFGYKVVYNPLAVGYHARSTTVRKIGSDYIMYHQKKSHIRMLIKNFGVINLFLFLPLAFFFSIVGIIIFNENRMSKVKAWVWNMKNLPITFNERKKVQKLRKVNDKEINKYFSKLDSKVFINKIK